MDKEDTYLHYYSDLNTVEEEDDSHDQRSHNWPAYDPIFVRQHSCHLFHIVGKLVHSIHPTNCNGLKLTIKSQLVKVIETLIISLEKIKSYWKLSSLLITILICKPERSSTRELGCHLLHKSPQVGKCKLHPVSPWEHQVQTKSNTILLWIFFWWV